MQKILPPSCHASPTRVVSTSPRSPALYDGPMQDGEDRDPFLDEDEGRAAGSGAGRERDELSGAPGRVAGIVAAAERTATELREQAEGRARERISEADRAAENRVAAAEQE